MDAITQQLEAATRSGQLLWLPVRGRLLAPLLRPGDRAGVAPCTAEVLRKGDVALIQRQASWTALLVVGRAPLRTAALGESSVIEEGTVRGRLVMLDRDGRQVRWNRTARGAALLRHHAMRSVAWSAARTARNAMLGFAPVRAARAAWLRPVIVRTLTADDADALDGFTARYLRELRRHVVSQCRTGWGSAGFGMGVFDRRGRMIGFGFVDEYTREGIALPGFWMRGHIVTPAARGLGLGAQLYRAQCEVAAVRGMELMYADVLDGNATSLHLLRQLGFTPAAAALEQRANELLQRPAEPHRVVLQLRLSPGPAAVRDAPD